MKTYMLKGILIEIGSIVRYMDDTNYEGIHKWVNKPVLGGFYKIRGFSVGCYETTFLLEGVDNSKQSMITFDNRDLGYGEPGFNPSRFSPVATPSLSEEEAKEESKSTGIKVKIRKEIIESLDLESISMN